MNGAEFEVARDERSWTVRTASMDYALLPSRRQAVAAAVEAARLTARKGRSTQVVLRNEETGAVQSLWSSAQA